MKIKTILFASLLLFSLITSAQSGNYWQLARNSELPQDGIINYSGTTQNPLYYNLDKNQITSILINAPDRFTSSNSSVLLKIPNAKGDFNVFQMFSTETLAAGSSIQNQNIKSYVGRNISNKSHTLRLTITPFGFYGMTSGSNDGQVFINPYANHSDTYMVYAKSQVFQDLDNLFMCEVEDNTTAQYLPQSDSNVSNFINDGKLRRYRLAVGTTVEYSNFHWQLAGISAGDSDANKRAAVLAAIVVTIDRVNEMYERDLGVTLQLVSNNDNVIYLGDASLDPYTNNDVVAMLDENQNTLDDFIGFLNYDIGHVFSTGGGGIAAIKSVCNLFNKARGVTGLPSPVGDVFYIDYVSHEIGHQFGALHTQNNDCQRNISSAMEPGSGSTIMGYAGICAPNVQNKSDAMFHYISISQMSSSFGGTTGPSSCAEEITIPNSAPNLAPLSNYIIPANTAFTLDVAATDSEGDNLTYSWEQIDNQVAVMPPSSTSTGGPSFRVFLPTTDSFRHFPNMNTLLN